MTRRTTLLRLATAAGLALTSGGCSLGGESIRNPFAPRGFRGDDGTVQILVDNQNFGDATVHAYRGSERFRLGHVTGKTEKRFTIRWSFSLPMEFDVHLIGGGDCKVRPMPVDPGDRVWVRIPTQISMYACYSGKS